MELDESVIFVRFRVILVRHCRKMKAVHLLRRGQPFAPDFMERSGIIVTHTMLYAFSRLLQVVGRRRPSQSAGSVLVLFSSCHARRFL